MERALALRDVMNHAVRVQREITDIKPLRPSRTRGIVTLFLCVLLLGASVYSLVARPELIWGPGARPVTPVRQDANLRVAVFLLAQRVESYRQTEGVYPSSLQALGDDSPEGIAYALVADSVFELRAEVGSPANAQPIVFRSNEDPEKFLGNSIAAIGGERTK